MLTLTLLGGTALATCCIIWYPTACQRPALIASSTGVNLATNGIGCVGSLGPKVEDASGTKYVLSDNHMFASLNRAYPGQSEVQPGLPDIGVQPAGAASPYIFGYLTSHVPLEGVNTNIAVNEQDSALVLIIGQPTDGSVSKENTWGVLSDISQIRSPETSNPELHSKLLEGGEVVNDLETQSMIASWMNQGYPVTIVGPSMDKNGNVCIHIGVDADPSKWVNKFPRYIQGIPTCVTHVGPFGIYYPDSVPGKTTPVPAPTP